MRLVVLQMYGVLTMEKKHHLHRQFIPRNNVHLAKKLNIFLLIAICAWGNLVIIHVQNQIGFLLTHGLDQIHVSLSTCHISTVLRPWQVVYLFSINITNSIKAKQQHCLSLHISNSLFMQASAKGTVQIGSPYFHKPTNICPLSSYWYSISILIFWIQQHTVILCTQP